MTETLTCCVVFKQISTDFLKNVYMGTIHRHLNIRKVNECNPKREKEKEHYLHDCASTFTLLVSTSEN